MKRVLLDLYSGAGGCTKGYQDAGFYVVGVDSKPQPNYCGDEFVQDDALAYVAAHGWRFDAIHASPPCQAHSTITPNPKRHEDLIPQTRYWLQAVGKPYVIENVPGARKWMRVPLMLCGTMFGLMVQRHRYFETNWGLVFAPASCNHWARVAKHGRPAIRGVEFAGISGHFSDTEYARQAMGIDWMTNEQLAQAIPPAYTHFIGRQLMRYLDNQQAAPADTFRLLDMLEDVS